MGLWGCWINKLLGWSGPMRRHASDSNTHVTITCGTVAHCTPAHHRSYSGCPQPHAHMSESLTLNRTKFKPASCNILTPWTYKSHHLNTKQFQENRLARWQKGAVVHIRLEYWYSTDCLFNFEWRWMGPKPDCKWLVSFGFRRCPDVNDRLIIIGWTLSRLKMPWFFQP